MWWNSCNFQSLSRIIDKIWCQISRNGSKVSTVLQITVMRWLIGCWAVLKRQLLIGNCNLTSHFPRFWQKFEPQHFLFVASYLSLYWYFFQFCGSVCIQVEDCERAYFKMDNVLIDDRRIHVDFSQSVAKVKFQKQGIKRAIIS